MSLGIRGKLFALSTVLVLAVVLTGGIVAEIELRDWFESHSEAELDRLTNSTRVCVEILPGPLSIESANSLVNRLGASTSARITIVASNGTVLGDSRLSVEQVRALENHLYRPEIQQALTSGTGTARRYSSTLQTDMLYRAVPFVRPDGTGVVRGALPLDKIDAVVTRLRVLLLVAGLIAVGGTLLVGGMASHLATRTMRGLVEKARRLAEGGERRIRVGSTDEIGGLVGSLNRLADDLADVVADLSAERDRFANVLEGMEEAVLAFDENFHVTLVNTAALTLIGLSQSPIGKLLLETIRIPALQELVSKTSRGEPATVEFTLHGPAPRQVLARARHLKVSPGVVVVLHDITELRRLESVRRDFVANASHELRTPVSVIRANAETLLDGAVEEPPQAREFLEVILRNADRLSSLIADLLDISRIEANRYALELRNVVIDPVVQQAVAAVLPAAKRKRHELNREIAPDLEAWCDAKGLEQVLLNLLDNAIKYVPDGGHIVVRGRYETHRVYLEVADDGPGIEPKHRQRIFERFYRVDPGRSREMGGTGLGLAIVKHLAESMGGNVGLESASPHGAIFWISLPNAEH